MLGIMADVDKKDSVALFSGSCMCKVGFTGDSAPRAVFLSLLSSSPDARHHGRYVPLVQFGGEYGSVCRKLWIFSSCSSP